MISREVVDAVLADRQANGTCHRKLAKLYGISRASVGTILRNQNAYRLDRNESDGIHFRKVPVYDCPGCQRARVDIWPCPACLARNGKHTFG